MTMFKVNRSERQRAEGKASTRRKCSCAAATFTSVFVVVAIFLLTAYNLYRNRFDTNQFAVHVGDEIALSRFTKDLSEKFCSGYNVELWDRAEVFKIPSRARTDQKFHKRERFGVSYVHGAHFLNTLGFYLLENSTVSVTGCHRPEDPSDVPGEMSLYRGDFDHSAENREAMLSKQIARVKIPRSATCSNDSASSTTPFSRPLPELTYRVTQEGNYYVFLEEKPFNQYSTRHEDGGMRLDGILQRTFYDVSGFTDSCEDRFVCRLGLNFESDRGTDVVIRIRNNPVTPMAKSSFSTHCHLRVMFWLGIFAGVPVVLVAALSTLWAWWFCVRMPPAPVVLDEAKGVCRCRCQNDVGIASVVGEGYGGEMRYHDQAGLLVNAVAPHEGYM